MKAFKGDKCEFSCEEGVITAYGGYYREGDRDALPPDALVRDGVQFTLTDIVNFLEWLGYTVIAPEKEE